MISALRVLLITFKDVQETNMKDSNTYLKNFEEIERVNELNTRSNLTIPYNLEAEQAILGAILSDNESLFKIYSIISEEDFYKANHKIIYASILKIIKNNDHADFLTVAEQLMKREQLDKAGGRNYLIELIESTPSIKNIESYANIIRAKSLQRKTYIAACKIEEVALNPGDLTTDEMINEIEKVFFTALQSHSKEVELKMINIDEQEHLINRLCSNPDKNRINGLETGFDKLDAITSGLKPGNLVIIAGRPSMGKTAFAINIAQHCVLKSRKAVGIFSLEMSEQEIITRMLSSLSSVPLSNISTGQLSNENFFRVNEAINQLRTAPVFISEKNLLTAFDVQIAARRLKHQRPDLSLIILDYIQLMSGTTKKLEYRTRELGEISRSLKALSRELDIPVVALSQLSRRVEERNDKRPVMSDLRDSGEIEQDADLVICMYRDSVYTRKTNDLQMQKDPAEAIICKHRNGPLGTVKLIFEGKYTRFSNFSC